MFRPLQGRLHSLPTCMLTLAHLPWWSCCSSQQWASCKAKAALDRWCSPSRPKLNGSPTASRASNGGHRYRGHCGEKGKSWSADLPPLPLLGLLTRAQPPGPTKTCSQSQMYTRASTAAPATHLARMRNPKPNRRLCSSRQHAPPPQHQTRQSLTEICWARSLSTARGPSGCSTVKAGTPGCRHTREKVTGADFN